ncbi:MAG TPA: hypothetical protein VNJ08_06880 [Bacteriovoracaceae bacterium]|nr:hypothetical protein [Bacteriovoracaceae bacterium]
MLIKLIGIVLAIHSMSLFAHPVIYKEGIVASSSNMMSYSDNQIMYSWSNRWSSGLNHWRFTKNNKNTEFAFLKTNHLLYRYNGEYSQGNVYIHGGIGVADSEIEKKQTNEGYMTGFELDWETRTIYTALKHYYFISPKVTDLSMTQARVGFSPYEAGFDQLQSWLMLQAMYMPDVEREITITPLLRFFYKNVLWEIGSSTRAEWLINVMVHY